MAALGDAVVSFPVSGAQDPEPVFLRVSQISTSASFYSVYHPGGNPPAAVQLVGTSPNRKGLYIMNSSSLPLGISWGSPPASAAEFGAKINALALFSPSLLIFGYTGPYYGRWDGSGSLSSSVAFVTEFF